MKKYLILTFSMFFLFGSLSKAYSNDDSILKGVLPGVEIKNFSFLDDVGLYEVVTNNQIFYLSKDLRFLILGNVIDLKNGRNLTDEKAQSYFKINFDMLPLRDAIKISEGTRKIAVFTDPDCPYCKKLYPELKKLTDVAVYVFLLPLETIHPGSHAKAQAIWCSRNNIRALDDAFEGKPIKTSSCSDHPVDRIIQLANRLNIRGVPSIIFDSGVQVNGYVPFDQLARRLNQK